MKPMIPIFGAPRSGTSWLGQIFNSSPEVIYRYQPLHSYDLREFAESLYAKPKNTVQLPDKILKLQDAYTSGNIEFFKDTPKTLVWKETHFIDLIPLFLEELTINKLIFIYRNPIDAIQSWVNNSKEFDSEWAIEEEYFLALKKNTQKYQFFGLKKWIEISEMIVSLERKYPNKIIILDYQELKKDTIGTVKKIFKLVNLEYTEQTKLFIHQSKSAFTPVGLKIKSHDYHSHPDYSVLKADKSTLYNKPLPSNIIQEIHENIVVQDLMQMLSQISLTRNSSE